MKLFHTIRKKLHASKTFRLFAITLLVLAIPLTVFVAQKTQEFRGRASTNAATITVSPTTIEAGNAVTVSWHRESPNTPPTTPSTLQPVYNLYRKDNGNIHYYTMDLTEKDGLLNDGKGDWSLSNIAFYAYPTQQSGTIPVYEVYRSDNGNIHFLTTAYEDEAKKLADGPDWDWQVPADPHAVWYVYPTQVPGTIPIYGIYRTDNGNIHFYTADFTEADGLTKGPDGLPDEIVKDADWAWQNPPVVWYAYPSASVQGFNLPSLIEQAYAQTAITGGETLVLISTENGTEQTAGPKIFLNCETQNDTIPPTALYSGECQYHIPQETIPGSYFFRMFAADGTTVLGESSPFTVTKAAPPPSVENQFIVTFKDTSSKEQTYRINSAAQENMGIASEAITSTEVISPNSIVVETHPGQRNEVMKAYAAQEGVEVVPDYIFEPLFIPNDPQYPNQTELPTIHIPEAWDITPPNPGSKATVAVLDSGIKDNPDLPAISTANRKDFTGTGITPDSDHGTSVSSTIASITNNAVGMAGVAGNVQLVDGRIIANNIATSSNIIAAITWAVDEKHADVINLSLGSTSNIPCFTAFQNALDHAWQNNVVVVIGAGNSGRNTIGPPANCNHVISVGATTKNGTARWTEPDGTGSNYGSQVLVAAPGKSVVLISPSNPTGFTTGTGTSFATGMVSGIAALLKMKNGIDISPDFISEQLCTSATPMPDFKCGLVNAAAALSGDPPKPTPTPTLTPTPTQIPTPTPTPSMCNPRPSVKISTVPTGDGRLRVTIASTTNPDFFNVLTTVTWNKLDNATVDGMSNATQGQKTTLATGTITTTFIVSRVTSGQATTVHFTVTDSCGNWPTFVGGGPNAF